MIFYKTEKFTLEDWTSVEYYQPHIDVLNREELLARSKMAQIDLKILQN